MTVRIRHIDQAAHLFSQLNHPEVDVIHECTTIKEAKHIANAHSGSEILRYNASTGHRYCYLVVRIGQ